MTFIELSKGFSVHNFSIHNKNTLRTVIVSMVMVFAYIMPTQSSFALEPQQKQVVSKLIEAFKQNNRVAVVNMVSYPLERQAPIPAINNQNEFMQRYDEVFDRTLLNTIIRSNIHTDWDNIGWQGVILNNGIVALDPDGNITEIKHVSSFEQTFLNRIQAEKIAKRDPKGRRALHRSVNEYNQALVELTTNRFHIRVDEVAQGQLRYASWALNKNTSDVPDLILNNGRMLPGSGRNQRFIFNDGTSSYELSVHSTGASAVPAALLEVYEKGQLRGREVATKVIRR